LGIKQGIVLLADVCEDYQACNFVVRFNYQAWTQAIVFFSPARIPNIQVIKGLYKTSPWKDAISAKEMTIMPNYSFVKCATMNIIFTA
jgi:hypothetical protein